VIAHLEKLIKPDWRVIEHGSGGSTLWFSDRVAFVTAYETDSKWSVKLHRINIAVKNSRTPFTPNEPYNLLLIDGEPVEDRREWIRRAPQIVRPGGWVVLDNANRPEYTKERKHLQAYAAEVVTFDVNEGGTQYLVTEFYRMPGEEGEG
jgi:predicted O-methyltransferase YrrM